MDFSHTANGKGTQFTKIALVAALHVAVGAAVVSSMDSKAFKMPQLVEDLVMINVEAPKPPPPPPPPEPPTPKVKPVVTPTVQVPVVEVDVPQEPVEAPLLAATTETAPAEAADPGPPSEPAPAAPSDSKGKLFTAALANAGDCATPDYPASAARNGETGTVNLALLIGVDGRVTDSKVQKSSGSRALDRAAQSALSLCKFKPAMAGGTPEPAWGQIAYVWNLD